MSDKPQNDVSGPQAGNGAAPQINVLAQYIKDLSFESPGAPMSLQNRNSNPGINVSVNVAANPLSETEFDVVLSLTAKAGDDKNTLFHQLL